MILKFCEGSNYKKIPKRLLEVVKVEKQYFKSSRDSLGPHLQQGLVPAKHACAVLVLARRSPLPASSVRPTDACLPLASLFSCPRWVFLHEKAYQVRDTAIESSVVTKVKGFGRYANRVMDVSDYVTPPQVWFPYPGGLWMPTSGEGRGPGPPNQNLWCQ